MSAILNERFVDQSFECWEYKVQKARHAKLVIMEPRSLTDFSLARVCNDIQNAPHQFHSFLSFNLETAISTRSIHPHFIMSRAKEPHITANSFLHSFSTTSSPLAQPSPPTIIYFISGNPGLIGYYHTFLSLLCEQVKSQAINQERKCAFHVYGHSLAGFELPETNATTGKADSEGVTPGTSHCYDLEEQICFVQKRLDEFITTLRTENDAQTANEPPRVILIGHSVGSYIAMEVLRRHRARTTTSEKGPVVFDIIGGAMLFPTVVDIAKSPSGQKLTVSRFPS